MSLHILQRLLREPPRADLGPRLPAAADGLVAARLPPERVGPVRAWRQRLNGFEKLARDDQEIELARGLRICATLAGLAFDIPPPRPPPDGALLALPGIGPTLAGRLAERDLPAVGDLAWFGPRSYEDLRRVVALRDVEPGARATFVAEVRRARSAGWRRRYVEVQLADGPCHVVARWFNVHASMAERFVARQKGVLSRVLPPRP